MIPHAIHARRQKVGLHYVEYVEYVKHIEYVEHVDELPDGHSTELVMSEAYPQWLT